VSQCNTKSAGADWVLVVLFSGGGIGGLTLAVALSRFPDIEFAVYEAAQSFKEIGAGVMIWGRTWRVLSLLDLDKKLREVAGVAIDGSEGTRLFSLYLIILTV
jgi:2-polyprenyl-6-methoxyphenol hydroxylase-like FAD-dependent oxidoreductase